MPCFDMKLIFAYHIDFWRPFGNRSNIISATSSPYLNRLLSQLLRKYSWESKSNKSGSLSSLSYLKKPKTARIGCTNLLRLALLSWSLEHTFQTCFPASKTRILIPHLNPFDAASTPLVRDRKSRLSTLAGSWVLGFTSFSNDSEDKN